MDAGIDVLLPIVQFLTRAHGVDLGRRLRHAPRVSRARIVVGDARDPPTLFNLFAARVRCHPDAEALRLVRAKPQGPAASSDQLVHISFSQLAERAQAIARGLLTLGRDGPLPPAARVAILCDTRLEWVLVDLACMMAGLVSVPLFPNVEPATLARVLTASDCQLVVAENPWQAKKFLDVQGQLALPPRLLLIDEVMTLASGAAMTLAELGPTGAPLTLAEVERRGEEAPPLSREAHRADECWTICYTPGTEGEPKGVMWTHANLTALTAQLASCLVGPEEAKKGDALQLLGLPLTQALGRVMLWMGLTGPTPARPGEAEVPLVTGLPRSAATLWEDARVLGPSLLVGVPSTYEGLRAEVVGALRKGGPFAALVSRWALAPHEDEASLLHRLREGITRKVVSSALKKHYGGRCRTFLSGGAPLGEGVQGFYLRHGIALRAGYGLVETAALTHLDLATPPCVGSVGPALPGVEQRLGADDELYVRGPQVSPGYWRDPQATSQVFDTEGWFATGDLAHIDAEGRAFITGRKREIIVLSNGRTLAPRPIEALLREDPLVAHALVYGDRRDFATALIALDPDELGRLAERAGLSGLDVATLSRHPIVHAHVAALIARTNQHLPAHAVLRKHAVLAEVLSDEAGLLTPTKTLRRPLTRDRYRSLLDSFYAESF